MGGAFLFVAPRGGTSCTSKIWRTDWMHLSAIGIHMIRCSTNSDVDFFEMGRLAAVGGNKKIVTLLRDF